MAYSERYFVKYCSDHGEDCRISIEEIDYEGTPDELMAQENPFTLTYENSDDFLYTPIRTSSCTISLVLGNGNEFSDIWVLDENKYKVKHYIDGEIDWIGFVIPDGFKHELKGGIYYADLNATDGLSTLEKLLFTYDNGDTYGRQNLTYNNGAEFPFSLVATEILRKLKLDIDTWICDSVKENTMSLFDWETKNDRSADPWSLSYVNVRTYINDSDNDNKRYYDIAGNAWDCKKVLENILQLHGCILYQEKGSWRILRVNEQEDFNPLYPPTGLRYQRRWHKYNTLNVHVGSENFGSEKTISNNTNSSMIGDSHVISMDSVFSQYRMFYKFQFKREGDTPNNLIKNPNFSGENAFSSTTGGANNWIRWRLGNKWFPRVMQANVSGSGLSVVPSGVETSIRFGLHKSGVSTNGTDPYAAVWAGVKQTPNISINKGDKLKLSMNIKIQPARGNLKGGYCYVGLIKVSMLGDDGNWYYLVNKKKSPGDSGVGLNILDAYDTEWLSNPDNRGVSDNFLAVPPNNYNSTSYSWERVIFNVPDAPSSGEIEFSIHGIGNPRGRKSSSFPPFKVRNRFSGDLLPGQLERPKEIEEYAVVRSSWTGNDVPPIEFTNIKFERIVPYSEDLAEKIEYLYENDNNTFTYNPDSVEVFNGDVVDQSHISQIKVPSRNSGKNFWKPVGVWTESASLGLITCKSIMNQYYRPNRILEGDVKVKNANFGDRFMFESLPGLRWILISANFNRSKGYIEGAVFRQITTVQGEIGCPGSENPEENPPDIGEGGGTEGGNNVDPEWINTGDFRCIKDQGLNTGGTQVEQVDNNPNSETYNETRWVTGEDDYEFCPIGEPSKYLFGVDLANFDVSNLYETPYEIDDDDNRILSINYYNPDGDKYLFLLHRAGSPTGLIERVFTTGQPGNIISDWQYLSDVNIGGYNYRVFRTDYTLASFDNFTVNFVFSQSQI